MNYEKCSCAHCKQHIEFPVEGTGQTIPCPTCEKPVLLTATNPRAQQRWVIVDTETDGLTYPIHVVEIAAQLMEGCEPCGSPFQVYLNHNVPIPSGAFAVHGYSQKFLRENGRPPVEAHEAFRQYAGESPIVAHSLGYDWNRALMPEWARLGLKPIGRRGFCTVSLSRRVLIDAPSYSLDDLKMRFGLADGPSHKAFGDVRIVVRLFREILRPRLESAGLTTFEAWQEFAQRTPILKCWRLIDPAHVLSLPQLNTNASQSFKSNLPPKENPSAKPVDTQPLALTKKMSRIPLSELTEVTIRGRTQSGDTPLHRAAKNGKFDEIPKHLLQIELFLVKNNRDETPLHFAAKHGHLDQIPSEFLTIETFTALDYYGRTPLHVAADDRHADQIPKEFLTPDILSLPTKNFTSNTILHFAAATNTLGLLPSTCITPKLLQIKNGYGSTPLEILNDVLPTQMQLTTLQEMGIAFDKARLTKQLAAGLIDAEHEKRRQANRMTLGFGGGQSSGSTVFAGPSARITVLAKSSSRKSPYKVEFMSDGPSVRVYCPCKAGVQQWMCKHKLALVLGDSNMLFDPRQTELLFQIQSWPQYSDLKQRTEEFQNKLRQIQETSEAADSKFYAWLETRNTDKQANPGEELSCGLVFIGIGDDDPEVQGRLEELNAAKAELKRKEKMIKEDFMLGLAMGFHRVGNVNL
jgi:DNA polymerase III epsilon subunit-like protein